MNRLCYVTASLIVAVTLVVSTISMFLAGDTVVVTLSAMLIAFTAIAGAYMLIFNDHHKVKRFEQMDPIHIDALTNSYNREGIQLQLKQMIARSRRLQRKFAVLYLDLDNFKSVNDIYGHHIGDQLLIAMIEKLSSVVREEDVVGRMGGDEFIVLMDGIEQAQEAHIMAERIIGAFSHPVQIENYLFDNSFSVGISVYPDNAEDYAELLQAADMAMYQAKDQGKNGFKFYNEALDAQIKKGIRVAKALQGALQRDEFIMHYQPKMRFDGSGVFEVEALLRWRHEDGSICMPSEFLKHAERSGAIVEIGKWIIAEVCHQIRTLSAEGYPTRISVNIASSQIKDAHFVDYISNTLKATGIEPSLLELEFSECVLHSEHALLQGAMQRLNAMGVFLTVDEFGKSFSAIGYLPRLPIHKIKIDRSIMNELLLSDKHRQLVEALITLGHQLDLSVTTEGIEVAAQLQASQELNADAAQGYLYAKPMDMQELLHFFDKRASA